MCSDTGLIEHEQKKNGGGGDATIYKMITRGKTLVGAIIKRAYTDRYEGQILLRARYVSQDGAEGTQYAE